MVIVSAGGWKLYYDHWCANRLDIELIWGPAFALGFVAECKSVPSDSGWLDEVWCEGGCVIDITQRHLLWFGGEDAFFDIDYRRAVLAAMAITWPGWRIEWATRGIVDLAARVGLAKEAVLVTGVPAEDAWREALKPEWADVVMTWATNEQVFALACVGDLEGLCQGPEAYPLHGNALASGWTWGAEELPFAGAHIDVSARTLSFWHACDFPRGIETIRAAWPGWTVRHWDDRFELHESTAGVDFGSKSDRSRRQLVKALNVNTHHHGTNPVTQIGDQLVLDWVNPWTACSASSFGSPGDKLLIAAQIAAGLGLDT